MFNRKMTIDRTNYEQEKITIVERETMVGILEWIVLLTSTYLHMRSIRKIEQRKISSRKKSLEKRKKKLFSNQLFSFLLIHFIDGSLG